MKHLGDITKINGAEIEPVWAIIGGSPCQDLSVAGKRAGLAGARSGLFMEQIRVIKEMRQHERDIGRANEFVRPRYMVWENVPGAFSSNKGEDFRAVLEEICRVADSNADVPQPPQKWSTAGCIMGNGWSVAWRVHDAQFWGVPQRRRRISVVADFGGQSAPEILFERKGVSGDIAESGTAGERITADAESGVGKTDRVKCLTPWDCQSKRIFNPNGCWNTLPAMDCGGANNQAVYAPTIARSLTARNDGSPCIDRGPEIVCVESGQPNAGIGYDFCPTLNSSHEQPIAAFQNTGRGWWNESDIGATVRTPCGGDSTKANLVGNGATVRRLTPLECERLQGYPDGWTDIPNASDSARYKALGNSIALPFWRWMLTRMSTYLPADATLGSLFDGIGGFPLIWEEIHGEGSARWASEIEPFPIRVTEYHFGETDNG